MVHADNDNERLVLHFFEVLSAGDLEAVRALLHEEVTWKPQIRDVPGAGIHRGKKGIVDDFLRPIRGMFKLGDPKVIVDTLASKGNLVIAEARGVGSTADGRDYDNLYAWAFDLKDGKVFAIREYMDSHYVINLFGSPRAQPAA
ncbi:MAG: nuclear transport factor 2 family protein [Steroidobacteraceae bacterium]